MPDEDVDMPDLGEQPIEEPTIEPEHIPVPVGC